MRSLQAGTEGDRWLCAIQQFECVCVKNCLCQKFCPFTMLHRVEQKTQVTAQDAAWMKDEWRGVHPTTALRDAVSGQWFVMKSPFAVKARNAEQKTLSSVPQWHLGKMHLCRHAHVCVCVCVCMYVCVCQVKHSQLTASRENQSA